MCYGLTVVRSSCAPTTHHPSVSRWASPLVTCPVNAQDLSIAPPLHGWILLCSSASQGYKEVDMTREHIKSWCILSLLRAWSLFNAVQHSSWQDFRLWSFIWNKILQYCPVLSLCPLTLMLGLDVNSIVGGQFGFLYTSFHATSSRGSVQPFHHICNLLK